MFLTPLLPLLLAMLHVKIFGHSVSLPEVISINFGIPYAGILLKLVKKKKYL